MPVAIVMPLVSLFSGAVLGPEGGIGGISSKLAAMYNEKVGIPVEHRPQLVFSTVASAYNGLIANPLFTGVLGSELIHDPDARARTLPANLIGGAIGYLIFISVGLSGLDNYLHLTDTQPLAPLDVVLVVLSSGCSAWAWRSSPGPCSASRPRSSDGSRVARSSGHWPPGSCSASSACSRRS